jgi:hypothetical protein
MEMETVVMAADFKQKHDVEPDLAPRPLVEPVPVQGQFRTELDRPSPPIEDTQCGRLKRPISGTVLQRMADGSTRRWAWKKRRS